MRLHLRRLVAWKGTEKGGCIHFRKGRDVVHEGPPAAEEGAAELVMLSNLAEFEEVIARLRTARAGRVDRVRRPAGARRGARRADFALVKNPKTSPGSVLNFWAGRVYHLSDPLTPEAHVTPAPIAWPRPAPKLWLDSVDPDLIKLKPLRKGPPAANLEPDHHLGSAQHRALSTPT